MLSVGITGQKSSETADSESAWVNGLRIDFVFLAMPASCVQVAILPPFRD